MLVKCQQNVGKKLGKSWENLGEKKCSQNVGQKLGKSWEN